jgi:hypothetical protein
MIYLISRNSYQLGGLVGTACSVHAPITQTRLPDAVRVDSVEVLLPCISLLTNY